MKDQSYWDAINALIELIDNGERTKSQVADDIGISEDDIYGE